MKSKIKLCILTSVITAILLLVFYNLFYYFVTVPKMEKRFNEQYGYYQELTSTMSAENCALAYVNALSKDDYAMISALSAKNIEYIEYKPLPEPPQSWDYVLGVESQEEYNDENHEYILFEFNITSSSIDSGRITRQPLQVEVRRSRNQPELGWKVNRHGFL